MISSRWNFRAFQLRQCCWSRLLLALALVCAAISPLATPALPAFALDDLAATGTDLNHDGGVSAVDISSIVMHWTNAVESGDACAAAARQHDLNGDGCLTIADVQAVSASVGARSSAARQSRATALGEVSASPLTVTVVSDGDDVAPGDGVCATSLAVCSLRAAITEANAQAGSNTIAFNIPGAGPHVIQIATELPVIADETGGTTIDGYSQPGAWPNTDPWVSNAVIKVQLDGPRAVGNPTSINGLQISSPNNVVRGLSLQRFKRPIWIAGAHADDNVIAGNFIGPSATGQPWYEAIDQVEHLGGDPGSFGVWLSYSAKRNRIGGVVPADRNVVSGNANDGIGMRNEGTESNLILGNLIGLGPSGDYRLRNYGDGIDMNYGSAHNRIGGVQARARNVISGNLGEGIEISHSPDTAYNRVINNHIGTSVDGKSGTSVHSNTGFAISLEDGVSNNEIGPNNVLSNNGKGGLEIYGDGNTGNHIFRNQIGIARGGTPLPNNGWGVRVRYHAMDQLIGPDNRIAYNLGPGVLIIDGDVDRNTVTQNRIYANTGLGIDIDPVGVNLNEQYSHNGANQRQNFPVLLSASPRTASGTACAGCTIEIFEADGAVGSYGSGKRFLGSGIANADGSFAIPTAHVKVGRVITSTATDAEGNTSEFSLNIAVEPVPPPDMGFLVPGRVEAEDYRSGGAGVAYADSTPGNHGGNYRAGDVDLFVCQDATTSGTCIAVGWVDEDEWLTYGIRANTTQDMRVNLRVASLFNNRHLRVELDGVPIGGSIAVPNTGGTNAWVTVTSDVVTVPAGTHVVRVYFERPGIWMNYIEMSLAS